MRLHAIVHGRVQGVGFRWFVRETARALSLAGWVSNRPDGTVAVEAEGTDASIAEFRIALGKGPEGASVSSVQELRPTSESLTRPFAIVK